MSKRNSGKFERRPRDLYDTPRAAVAPLLPYLAPGTEFAEPCAGHGWLIDALVDQGHRCVWATDIAPGRDDIGTLNAMTLPRLGARNVRAQRVITNPPWTRSILHPLIDRLSAVWPCWFLFDADWAYTAQSSALIERCSRIVPIGRVKWMPGSKHVGFDNVSWYEFTPGHEGAPHLMPWRRSSRHLKMMGPEERRRAEIVAAGLVADPGPLFETLGGGIASKSEPPEKQRAMPVVPAADPPRDRQHPPDEGSLAGAEVSGRHKNGAELHQVQQNQREYDGRPMGRVPASASAMVAALRSRLRPMVLPRLSARAFDE